jgi:hypothetical protein
MRTKLQSRFDEIAGKLSYARVVSSAADGVHDVAVDFFYPQSVQQNSPLSNDYIVIENASILINSITVNVGVYGMFLCTPDMRPAPAPNVPPIFQANGFIDPLYLGPCQGGLLDLGGSGNLLNLNTNDFSDIFPLVIPPRWFVRFASANNGVAVPSAGTIIDAHLTFYKASAC